MSDKGMRVELELDGERAVGLLLSAPNAIGVCGIRVRGEVYQRHVNRLRAVDGDAAAMLAGGDRFVARDPEAAIDRIIDAPKSALREWTIADVELLRVYAQAAYMETCPGPRTPKRHRQHARMQAAVAFIKSWIKQSRMDTTATNAGLTPEQAKDPVYLLRAAVDALVSLGRHYHETTGGYPERENDLMNTIRNYLNHHAPALRDPGRIGGE